MPRLERVMAQHWNGDSCLDSRGNKEGEGESRPLPRSLPAGWVTIEFTSWRTLPEEEEGWGR